MQLIEQGWLALITSLGESAPYVVFGLLLAGIIREFVPSSVLKNRLGGVGLAPVLRAVGLGAILPICSCSTIPLGLGMARSGAGAGTALAFMTSAPAISPITVVLGFSLLGPYLLGAYSIVVLLGACALGIVGNRVLSTTDDLGKEELPCSCGCDSKKQSRSSRIYAASRWALFDLGSEISLSLFIGLLIASAILVMTPDQWIQDVVGNPGPWAFMAVVLLAIPAYTCSVPALLIAASLIAKGAHPSIAIAFLIAGPATNFGELNAIRVGLGIKSATFYLSAVLLLAIISSVAIGVLPIANTTGSVHFESMQGHHHAHTHFGERLNDGLQATAMSQVSLWRWPFIVTLFVLAFHAVYKKYFANSQTIERKPNAELGASVLISIDQRANGGLSR